MAYNEHRFSNYSVVSNGSRAVGAPQSNSISTQTLLNGLHSAYSAGQPFVLDSSTSLVINTWLTAATEGPGGRQGGTIDVELIKRVWEHARRRLEDGCIFLGSLHESAPSLLTTVIASFPIPTPDIVYTAISAVQPFVQCVTPQNPSLARYSAIAAILTVSPTGNLSGVQLKLSTSGIDTSAGLLNIPSESGYRGFDVFYYLLSAAATPAERENLGLQRASSYSLLKKSETYQPPAFLPTADDSAAAEELRSNLKAIGITGNKRRNLLSALAALLKLGETFGFLIDDDVLEKVCDEVAELLDIDAELLSKTCNTREREYFVSGLYEAIVDWVIANANRAIAGEIAHGKPQDSSSESEFRGGAITPVTSDNSEDTVSITIVDIPSPKLGKAAALRNIFDDAEGINAEMKHDGVTVTAAGHSVLEEMKSAVRECEPELGIRGGPIAREKEMDLDRREAALDKVGQEVDDESFVKQLLYPVSGEGIALGRTGRFDLSTLMGSSRVWFHLSLHPTDELPANLGSNGAPWSAGSPSRQLRAWRLPEWANRRNKHLDFTADFDMQEFCDRYRRLGCEDGRDGIESFILQRGWSNGEVIIGTERIWIREGAWWEAESMLDVAPGQAHSPVPPMGDQYAGNPGYAPSYFTSPFGDHATYQESTGNLLTRNQSSATLGNRSAIGAKSLAPTNIQSQSGGDYGLGRKGDDKMNFYNELDPELADAKHVESQPITASRRMWAAFTWALTFWIPSFMLKTLGRMKRPDVRMAWREKLVLVFLIFFLNAAVVFYIIGFGRILCPNFDKAWNPQELSYHQGENDFWVGVKGKVYDISKFWKLDHSTISAQPVTDQLMLPNAGKILDSKFPIPLYVGCAGLVTSQSLVLQTNVTAEDPAILATFDHQSGSQSPFAGTPLKNPYWFNETFLPRMKDYYKGDVVYKRDDVESAGTNDDKMWVILNNFVYDLSDYFYTQSTTQQDPLYSFLDPQVEKMIQENPGTDITSLWDNWKANNRSNANLNYYCLNNQFYVGKTDFRATARCQVNNYLLLAFTIVLCAVILVKFLAALQLGSKRRPAQQDKFVICQVPAYTEGEDQLRKGLDSLTALAYDNKRKLICVICDGMIVGGGNDRPTPKIVLDILGVDPKIDPPALPFKSVGAGSEQLNYGKVYSGLYEYEGNVVPYVVVVKVGKESEQTKAKPGNRGKRDSQIMLMSFLNRVHHRAPMNPLELEMFHQINNIIGVDPELYEYLFMVDADTMVKEDALNRLVASCANDAKVAGICGETSLENEERSWWTMIQVYEYYISHHLAKAFESLFGSVTCLPGCFCMYRLRTADKGKPLIISDKVINEYSDCEVDTLHKKNLLALGEDRYLTTLMTKHFPHMSYKFVPDAYAHTAAPETWSILLSQRRRWINSTIHNLAELIFIKDMCGFCCFSMRFVVFIDLFGTIILPATCAYLGYLIYRVATHSGSFPLISIIMIAAVYGLQAIIFIIKRQWQHIGWMIIYLIAFPIYSFVLPIYSFWKQDDFSWGNTRIVIGEKGHKQVLAVEDEGFDPRSIPMQRWDDYATSNNLPGRRGQPTGMSEKASYAGYDDTYEMDDMRSVYSAAKPASTILTGFKSHNQMYMPPQSPAPFARPDLQQRNSGYSNMSPYTDHPSMMMDPNSGRLMSMGNMSDQGYQQRSPYASRSPVGYQSTDNLTGMQSPGMGINRAGTRSPLGMASSRHGSTPNLLGQQQGIPNFQNSITGFGSEPTNQDIIDAIQQCLGAVDLDNVTKKQLKALTEQRLQCQLSVERRAFLDRQIDFELANM